MILNRLAPRSMDVDGGDLVASRDDVIGQTDCELVRAFPPPVPHGPERVSMGIGQNLEEKGL